MHKNNQKRVFAATFVVGAVGLGLLSGCGWMSSSKDAKKEDVAQSSVANKNDVLLSIDGKPVLTVEEYEDQLEAARQAHQEIEMLLQMMPNAEREYIFQGIATGKIMEAWAKKEGISDSAPFKKQQKQMHDAMDLQLYMAAFYDKNPLQISDADVKEFYETKKDSIPGLKTAEGGVQVAHVRFDSKAAADSFLEKVKEVKDLAKFKAAGQAAQLTVADQTINEKSALSDSLKNAVLSMKQFPKVEVVKVSDDAFWVVFASGKSEAQYHDLKSPQVQQGLKKMMSDERRQKQLEEFVGKAKKDMNIEENGEYFDNKESKKRAAMEAMMKQQGEDQSSDEDQDMDDMNMPAEKL
jgi:hypothetical protein